MTAILQNKKHKLLAIYLMPDHAHILIGLNSAVSISETVKVLKVESTNFINENRLIDVGFNWQEGYGAFSHSREEIDRVIKYILNQREHHMKKAFRNEFYALLERYEIEFNSNYMFEFFDEPT
jgi:putative transposase